ncbi:S8 family serine peptidase [Luteolibacter luteus]|uniref:S8 family serine peptidase n=2 Tax=Luteolibacter luteus TaxID=2728835 RepID=A0A858RTG0_9BACT|nr:S8 family serine peptidase [Luteolibacter luteus]
MIVKVRPEAAAPARAGVRSFGALESASAGLGILQRLERAGVVKAVHSLAGPSRGFEPEVIRRGRTMTAAALETSFAAERQDPSKGGSMLVELSQQSEDELARLRLQLVDDPYVEYASLVPIRYLMLPAKKRPRAGIAATPPATNTLWNLDKILWRQARGRNGFVDADGVSIAVLDSGIDEFHPDLQPVMSSNTMGYPDVPSSSSKDVIGHGTHVAGIIGAAMNNGVGINGVCRCQLHGWKIFDDEPDYDGESYVYWVDPVMYYRALRACIREGIQIVNLSIGGGGEPDQDEKALFAEMVEKGTVVVAAMGNERTIGSPVSYPAALPGVIAVGATDLADRVARFSNSGNHISVSAPGVGIWSTLPTYAGQTGFNVGTSPAGRRVPGSPHKREIDYDEWDGTSMAAPHVAGAAALYLARNPDASPEQVKDALERSADQVPGMRGRDHHPDFGFGRINLEALLAPPAGPSSARKRPARKVAAKKAPARKAAKAAAKKGAARKPA